MSDGLRRYVLNGEERRAGEEKSVLALANELKDCGEIVCVHT